MFRVATINLHSRQDNWIQRRHLLVNELLEIQPDILSMQEVRLTAGQGWWLVRQLNSRLGSQTYQLVQQRLRHVFKGYFEGIGVLSKLPVLSKDSIGLGANGRVAMRITVELASGHAVDVVSTHLHSAALQPEVREQQVTKLIGWLGQRGSASCQVVAGDFNEVPTGLAIQRMKQVYQSAYEQARGHEPFATFPTPLVEAYNQWAGCLDYIFLSSTLEAKSADLFGRTPHPDNDSLYPSDHVGVTADITLRDTA